MEEHYLFIFIVALRVDMSTVINSCTDYCGVIIIFKSICFFEFRRTY